MKVRLMKTLPVMIFGAALFLGTTARAETTKFHSYEGFNSFLEGDAKGTQLSADGQISLAPAAKTLYAPPDGRISAYAQSGDKTVIALTDSGRLSVVGADGSAEEWGEVPHGVVTAVALDGKTLYVATAAPTKLLRFSKPGKFDELALPKDKDKEVGQIWALQPSHDGLLVGSASPGDVFRWDGKKFELVFRTADDMVRSLAVGDDGIFAGGGTKGVLYRGGGKKGFAALLDTGLDEITQIAAQGTDVYLVGLGGATRDAKGERVAEKGKIRAQLIKVDKDGFADAFAGSDDEILYGLSLSKDGNVYVATGSVDHENPHGRVYTAHPVTRKIAMIYQSTSAQAVGIMARASGGLAIVTNDPPAVEALEKGLRKEGEFILPVFDAATQTRFGAVQLDADQPRSTRVSVALRTGQTQIPDTTWSGWSKELSVGEAQTGLQPARFVQAKILLHGDGAQTPNARRVRLAFGRQNLAPFVSEVVVLPKGILLSPLPQDAIHEHTYTVNDKGFGDLKHASEPANDFSIKARQTYVPGAQSIAWLAQDPNGDQLLYDLYYRADGDKDFRLLKADWPLPFYAFDAGSFADGHYQFRVVAKDDDVNPPGEGKRDSRDSLYYTFDNTPPQISGLQVSKQRLSFTAKDSQSPIVRAEYSLDGSPLRPLLSQDGLLDSKEEHFDVTIPAPEKSAPSHSLSVRVEDEGGNSAAAGTTFH